MELERYIPYEAFPHSWDPKGPINFWILRQCCDGD
jgi:hypothetical protein